MIDLSFNDTMMKLRIINISLKKTLKKKKNHNALAQQNNTRRRIL